MELQMDEQNICHNLGKKAEKTVIFDMAYEAKMALFILGW
jgi:hypothetical protein